MELKASHILVKDRTLALKIYQELKNGAKFEQLAKQYSQCPSKAKGGDLGFFGPGVMAKEFENAVMKLAMHRISMPVKTQFGYHIIKKTGVK